MDPAVSGWPGLGIAVQAYGKRAIPVLRWLRRLSEQGKRRIPVRLVKGAYWDSEIKWAQERGLDDYPVFTRKIHTDVSYLACIKLMLADQGALFPQFATHNAHSIASACVAASGRPFELQRLHGMGEALYDELIGAGRINANCRIYAPVGRHDDLVSYLVRRLLENGANTSFVNRLADDQTHLDEILRDPVQAVERERGKSVRLLPRPIDIFSPERLNSRGIALTEPTVRAAFAGEVAAALNGSFEAAPIVGGELRRNQAAELVLCPHDRRERVGVVHNADPAIIETALSNAVTATQAWDLLGGEARAQILDKAANLYERDRARLIGVMVREAGKTLDNALSDLREAIDFLRYYAAEARRLFDKPLELKGPTGETNTLTLRARGPFACISPWNFPLAIFTGQVAAALAAGNPVLAKPAEQTPITAFLATQLLHEAGVPADVLQLLPGAGEVGAALVQDTRVAGVVFTGSNGTATSIQRSLALRGGPIVPFIAETGGMNAMIAELERAARAGDPRPAALGLRFGRPALLGRAPVLRPGGRRQADDRHAGRAPRRNSKSAIPLDYATDIGPVIDEDALDKLESHKRRMQKQGKELVDLAVPEDCRVGTYVTPAAYAIADAGVLKEEVFGPILHVVRFSGGHLDKVIDAINATGYGLTLGLHSRIAAVADLRGRARPRRQPVRQPQPDRRRGRRTAVRRRGPVRHRPEGGRATLPPALRHRARAHHRHHRHRRQRRPAGHRGGVNSKLRSPALPLLRLAPPDAPGWRNHRHALSHRPSPLGAQQCVEAELARRRVTQPTSPARG